MSVSHDPLIIVTRRTKKGLLAVASGAVLLQKFSIEVTDIPAVGLTDLPKDLVPFVLKMVVAYLLIVFLFQFFRDILNASDPGFYKLTQERTRRKQERFIEKCAMNRTQELCDRFLEKFPTQSLKERHEHFAGIESIIKNAVELFLVGKLHLLDVEQHAKHNSLQAVTYLYGSAVEGNPDVLEAEVFLKEMGRELNKEIPGIRTGEFEKQAYRVANIFYLWGIEFLLPASLGAYALVLMFSPDSLTVVDHPPANATP